MTPPNEAFAETLPSRESDTMPAPPPSVFDDAPAWARALFLSCEETRAAMVELGSEVLSHRIAMHKLSYRLGAVSIALGLQEHRTREIEQRLPALAHVIPMRGV